MDINEPQTPSTADLFIHYSFENNVNDTSGNGNNAVLFTGDYVDGHCGKAARFDGDDYIELLDQARFLPLQSTSVSFWMKTTQTSRFNLIDQRVGSWSVDAHNFALYFNCCNTIQQSQNIAYRYPNYNTTARTTTLNVISNDFNDDQWHLMVFVKDVENETIKIYQDGCLIANRTIVDTNFQATGTLYIGKHFSNRFFYSGLLDEFRVYRRALNPKDIKALLYECAQLEVYKQDTCEICITSPQKNLLYHLQDTTGKVIESINSEKNSKICFSPIQDSLSLQIRVEDSVNNCSMILDTLLLVNCIKKTPPHIIPPPIIILPPCITNIVMPNVFTPNNDGSNDLFKIISIDCANPKQLNIYNRWGQYIFSTTTGFEWDGTYNGNSASDGVYYWTLEATSSNNDPISKTGFVHLLR